MHSQLDYVYFLYGLGFILVAVVCQAVARLDRQPCPPWRWLTRFGFVHGAYEWLDMLALSLGDCPMFRAGRLVVMAVSYLCLLEFGRQGELAAGRRAPGRWILAVLLGLSALGWLAGPAGLNAACRYGLGFPGALWSARALWLHRRARHPGSRPLLLAAAALAGYALFAGLVTPRAGFFPNTWLNTDSFLSLFGFPVQFVRAALAVLLALGLWRHGLEIEAPLLRREMARWRRSEVVMSLVLLVLLGLGWLGTQLTGRAAEQDHREDLEQVASLGAAAINPRRVLGLDGSPLDLLSPDYVRLKVQLENMQRTVPGVTFIYLLRRVGGRAVILVDSSRVGMGEEALPGDECAATPPELVRVFASGEAQTVGPVADHFSTCMSAFAALRDPATGEVAAVLGVEFDASAWARRLAQHRLPPILITGLVCAIILAAHTLRRSDARARAALADSESRFKDIASQLGEVIWETDHDGRFLFVGGSPRRLLGLEGAELVGRHVFEGLDGLGAARLDQAFEAALAGEREFADVECRVRGAGGLERTVLVSAVAVRDGGGFRGVFKDVTERRRFETELVDTSRALAESERKSALIRDVAVAANRSRTVPEALRAALAAVAGFCGWPVGHALLRDPQHPDELLPGAAWHLSDPARFGEFVRVSEGYSYGRGVGLPGRALAGARLVRRGEVAPGAVPRRELDRFGLADGLAAPVLVAGRVEAVLEFFFGQGGAEVPGLEGLLETVCVQVGIAVERQQAEEAWRKLSLAVEQSPVSVVVTDNAGTIEYVNPEFCRVTGYGPNEALGQNPRILKSGQMEDSVYAGLWATILAGQTWRGELLNRKKSGELFWESVSISPIVDERGKITHFVGVKEDISAQKNLVQELKAARDAADAANQAKSDFLANMSHEIRTPLNAVLGMTELVLSSELTAEQRGYLSTVKASGDELLALIDDILDLSKIEAGQVRLEDVDFDLRDLVGETMKALAVTAHAKGLELAVYISSGIPDRLAGDPHRLRQVLVNLAGNAIKFTREGSVAVSVELGQGEEAGFVLFSIADTGIGIPVEALAHIFERFTQADASTTRRHGGTGLGTTISKSLVELMGGGIRAESEPGQGSVFFFTLPVRRPAGFRPGPAEGIAGLRVLVADDSAVSRDMLARQLTDLGAVAILAADGEEALAACVRARMGQGLDAALLDLDMPGLRGVGLAERLRAIPGCADLPVLFLASPAPGRVCADPGLAGSRCLDKPIGPRELTAALRPLLGLPGAEPAPEACPPSPEEGPARPLSILVAEDNPVNRQVIEAMLTPRGHRLTVAGDGGKALDLFGRERFDVVLMDVQMPNLDGCEASRRMRALERERGLARTPILAVTAYASPDEEQRCIEAGMDGYLTKPVQRARLIAAVEAAGSGAAAAVAPPPGPAANGPGQVLDRAMLLEELGGDESSAREIARAVLSVLPGRLAQLEAAAKGGDAEGLRSAAHGLRGMAGNIRAHRLALAARRMEELAAGTDVPGARALLTEVEAEAAALIRALRDLLAG